MKIQVFVLMATYVHVSIQQYYELTVANLGIEIVSTFWAKQLVIRCAFFPHLIYWHCFEALRLVESLFKGHL